MSEGKRPGGLTALAVFNFMFFANQGVGIVGLLAMYAFAGRIKVNSKDPQAKAQMEAFQDLGMGEVFLLVAVMALTGLLLLLSGIGYLKQKRVLGRGMGNGYAILGVITTVAVVNLQPEALGGGFTLMTILGLLYPVLTLAMINMTFKEDFIN